VSSVTPFQDAAGWQCIVDEQIDARTYQRGQHCKGDVIRVDVPRQAEDPSQPARLILDLHGFSLCLSSFQEAHLRELARQGHPGGPAQPPARTPVPGEQRSAATTAPLVLNPARRLSGPATLSHRSRLL
jgi:hypothetical protein